MPYNSVNQLPENIKKLPLEAQKVFLKVFNQSFQKYGEGKSFAIAWEATKRLVLNKTEKKVLKSKGSIGHYKKLSSSDGGEYRYIEFTLSNANPDDEGEYLHPQFLKNLQFELEGKKADLEHTNELGTNLPKDWIAKIINSAYIDGDLECKAILNKEHPYYEDIWKDVLKGKYGASLELEYKPTDYYYDEKYKVYANGKIDRWSLTKNPMNRDSKIFAAYSA